MKLWAFWLDESMVEKYIKYLNMLIDTIDEYILPNITDLDARQKVVAVYNMAIQVRNVLTSDDSRLNKVQKLVLKLLGIVASAFNANPEVKSFTV